MQTREEYCERLKAIIAAHEKNTGSQPSSERLAKLLGTPEAAIEEMLRSIKGAGTAQNSAG